MRRFLLRQYSDQRVEGTLSDKADDTPLQSKLTALLIGLSTLLSWQLTMRSTTKTFIAVS